MVEWVMGLISVLLCLFEGYCIQSFFGRFAVPKLYRIRNAGWAAGIAWIVIRAFSEGLFSDTDSVSLIMELLFTFCTLFVFCVCWYQGNVLLKIFLAVQFISLRELSFWTGYSLIYIGNEMIEALAHKAGIGMASAEYLPVAAGMEHLYDGIRSVKHDMKNHMAVLQNLIQKRYSGEDEEIRQYFEGMRQSVEQIDSRVHTGNAVSDAVVGSKFRYAAKKVKGIRLDASKFMLTDAVTIKAYDMGIILNNGLDNAVEACMQMREKQPDAETYITIRSFRAKNMYFIEIENSFDGSALSRGDSGLPISTKKDKEVHGIGLKNIRKCAVKYGGDLDCIVEGNKFTLSVMVKS